MYKLITAAFERLNRAPYHFALGWAVVWGVFAVIANTQLLMSADYAWLTTAVQRMAAGETIYTDFYETNPPLIFWLHLIPAYAVAITGIAAQTLFPIFLIALAGGSLWLVWGEIRRHPILSPPDFGSIVFAALAQGVFGWSFLFFGQREHLFWILVMPYIVQTSALVPESKWSIRQFLIALMAGMAFSLKPYFVLIWVAGEVARAWLLKNPRELLRPVNWVIGSMGVAYCLAVWLVTPQYYIFILPMVFASYKAFTADPNGHVFSVVAALLVMYLLPAYSVRLDTAQRRFRFIGAVWIVAALGTVALQDKGFLNHYFPVIALGGLLFSSMFGILIAQLRTKVVIFGPKVFAALWAMGFILFLLPIYHFASTLSVEQRQRHYISALQPYVERTHRQHPPMYIISFMLGDGYPALGTLPVTAPFHFHHLWMLPAVMISEHNHMMTPALENVKNTVFQTLANDLERARPALVVVSNNQETRAGFKGFDFIAYFGQNPAFADAWKPYRPIGEIALSDSDGGGHYTVYSRQ